jgi:hypothetical protein
MIPAAQAGSRDRLEALREREVITLGSKHKYPPIGAAALVISDRKGRADGSFLSANWQRAYGVPSADHDVSCSDWNWSTSGHMSLPIST